jgi:RNA polymerase primary sigma factor/RNA polymerase nonessential primary-like sigma factor
MLLTREQETALACRIRGEDVRVPGPGESRPSQAAACNRLVEESMGLVGMIARRYWRPPLSLDDLIQDGALALRAAVERFDPDRGFRFSTFAFPWVRHAVSRSAAGSSVLIHCPPELRSRQRRLARANEELTQTTGRAPTDREVARWLGIGTEEVGELRACDWQVVSYDRPAAGADDGRAVLSTLRDPGPAPDAQEERRALAAAVRQALTVLPPRERLVLSLRFGIGVARAHSIEEVARLLGLSRPRAQRLAEQGLARLRTNGSARQLLAFAA